jgi:hypothetical protein
MYYMHMHTYLRTYFYLYVYIYMYIYIYVYIYLGYCYLLQPKRGGTLDLFIDRINKDEGFTVIFISDNYCDEVNTYTYMYV